MSDFSITLKISKKKIFTSVLCKLMHISIYLFMKTINFLLKSSILLLTVLIASAIFYYTNISQPQLCDWDGYYVDNNLFWNVRQTGYRTWDVVFKNVNIQYKVTVDNMPVAPNTYNYNLVETNGVAPVNAGVTRAVTGENITDAVMAHFNDIQRGHFHPNNTNFINHNSHGRGIRSPLDQFEIRDLISLNAPILGNLHVSYTNIGLYLTIATFMSLTLNMLATNYNKVMANKWSMSQESTYATIHGIVISQINSKEGQKYYPFVYCLFIMILTSNLIGMVPYSFAPTSHFVLTFFVSFTVVLGATILGFMLHRLIFFSLFVPSGCPLALLPLLVLIEFISYLARNVSLGLRLAANILSGHMLLNILSEFTYNIMETSFSNFLLGIVPVMFIVAFSALELGIAFIQSQVFVVLSCSYVKDSLTLH